MGNKNKKSLFTSVLASRESSRGVAGVGTVRHNKLPWEPPGGVLALCGRRRRRPPGGWPHVESRGRSVFAGGDGICEGGACSPF